MARGPIGRQDVGRQDYYDVPVSIKLSETILEKMRERKDETGVPLSTQIRRAIEREISGTALESNTLDTALMQSRLKFLTRAPAGEWREALDQAGDFVLSRAVADYYDVGDADVVVGVQGESMEPAIPDGALLIMRPVTPHRQPVRGEIVLVQMWDDAGTYKSTIKEFRGMDGTAPRLADGAGGEFEPMVGAVGFAVVAVAKGIMARL